MKNRLIHYRIWDKKEQRYRKLDSLSMVGTYFTMIDMAKSYDDYVIQQFTGLVDEKGKPIYECDVVRICIDDSPENPEWDLCPVAFYRGGFALWVTSYDGKRRYFEGIAEFLTLINDKEYVDGEVIGNIFENPEFVEPSSLKEMYEDV